MIKEGQSVKCKPYIGMRLFDAGAVDEIVEGIVVYVNAPHRWFTVEYGKENKSRICFNFNDLGEVVWKI